jgi:hypothetical protein
MKCRACWSDKAYVRQVPGWRGALMSWVGIVPLKCHHCYHRFTLPFLLTIGKELTPPPRKPASPVLVKFPQAETDSAKSTAGSPLQRKAS